MADTQDRDQKTENATPHRLLKSREEGQIGFSSELMAGIMMATAVALIWGFGRSFFETLMASMAHRLSDFEAVIVEPRLMVAGVITDSKIVGLACLGFVVPIGVVALLCGLMQTQFNLSLKPLGLNWGKLSVTAGFGRIFSSKSLVRGALSILKATMILVIILWIARSKMTMIALSSYGSFREMICVMAEVLLYAATGVAALLLAVGIIDLGYQKWKHLQEIMMSRQDIKDENKDQEGDPLMKARVRRIQAEMSRKRMLADVPKATVVITNPTHYAVAISYDRETMETPIVVAKGADFLAKKIIEVAKQNGVAVIERKPVARFLYANTDVGSAIPFSLYHAVAEILNIVNRVGKSA
ncbi:EscU/YscU/HrcU family type III secretion system export apparatus switch protein [Stieleria varia]|uniref:Flagellar biosynthetic protein FlhB n=1 Tax=Stieleria varia TaxID=2528005 RepID=A0A5C6AR29_9BACT|nr:EscU/YscU/HrcU family type III secretion system export apparatus switch protein [Stieleria varia]TWU02180.1 Flagellar biosynthetic protein FlhB [Stieleria varia]